MTSALAACRVLGLVVLGIVLYAVCIDVFGGYPAWHSEALTRIGLVLVVVVGLVVWRWHGRQDEDAARPDGPGAAGPDDHDATARTGSNGR